MVSKLSFFGLFFFQQCYWPAAVSFLFDQSGFIRAHQLFGIWVYIVERMNNNARKILAIVLIKKRVKIASGWILQITSYWL